MNKKFYEQAEIKIVRFEKEDVIVASADDHYTDETCNNLTEIL